jgi:hypothetical protein
MKLSTHLHLVPRSERVELYLHSPDVLMAHGTGAALSLIVVIDFPSHLCCFLSQYNTIFAGIRVFEYQGRVTMCLHGATGALLSTRSVVLPLAAMC